MEPLDEIPRDLAGADLVAAGIAALRRGAMTAEALLVLIGAQRLRAAGLDVPTPPRLDRTPELALYDALCAAGEADPHGRYNSLVRRLVSFERALERRNSRAGRAGPGGDASGG